MQKAIFLDRDGTINLDVDYPHRLEDLYILAGVSEAIRIFKSLGFLLILITNQSGIAKWFYKEEQFHRFTHQIERNLCITFDGIYRCPHDMEADCLCRKPKPWMILQAIHDHHIDPSQSFMIGDRVSDVEAGEAAWVRSFLLSDEDTPHAPIQTFPSLLAFARSLQW